MWETSSSGSRIKRNLVFGLCVIEKTLYWNPALWCYVFCSTPQGVKSRAHSTDMTSKMEEMRVEMDEANRAVSCKCKGDCGTKRCACKKAGDSCQDNCKCRTENCSNRIPELPQSTTNDADLEKNQENVRTILRWIKFNGTTIHILWGPTCNQRVILDFYFSLKYYWNILLR